jgi:hypothetical protein
MPISESLDLETYDRKRGKKSVDFLDPPISIPESRTLFA